MPELIVCRKSPAAPLICMYCGKPATTKQEWREVNRKPDKNSGAADLTPVPVGDDPLSAVIGVLMFPLIVWELLKALVAAMGAIVGLVNRPATAPPRTPPPPNEPPTTLVVVTMCDQHRRFRDRFVWAGLGMVALLVLLWVWAILVTRRVMGTDDTGLAVFLILMATFATALLPIVLSVWYGFAGPVIVDRVTETTVVLDRVRQAYFDAAGIKPTNET